MSFNSLLFLTFLLVFVTAHWSLPAGWRKYLIFSASIFFYGAWRFEFVLLLLFSSTLDYFCALWMEKRPDRKKAFLVLSLVVNLGILVYFKYTIFILDSVTGGLALLGVESFSPGLKIILPLGISFYTFQTICYSVDVYRGDARAEKNWLDYTNYVIFFPQLVAGPILRVSEVLPQLKAERSFSYEKLGLGLLRVLAGLFLKIVIADNLAPMVDEGFSADASSLSAWDVWGLAFLFGFQIYFDFAGYSHVALGCAAMIGIKFPENFNFPYMSCSPREFWHRWHISLSSWIRDYLYIPLMHDRSKTDMPVGSSRGGLPVEKMNFELMSSVPLLVTWLLMGLWHGAGWTFAVWGLWHGCVVMMFRMFARATGVQARGIFGWLVTLPIVMAGWIPFRAGDMEQTGAMFRALLSPGRYLDPATLKPIIFLPSTYHLTAFAVMLAIVTTWAVHRYLWLSMTQRPVLHAVGIFVASGGMAAMVFVYLRHVRQFIYFQF